MLVIDEHGETLGEMSTLAAIDIARSRELDLALMAPQARPPVAKILDYGKYQYQQSKNARVSKANAKVNEAKGIRIGLRIGEHDLGIRIRQSKEFLAKGHKVQVNLRFRGREVTHADLGFEKMKFMADRLAAFGKVESPATKAGMQLVMTLAPLPNAKKALEAEQLEAKFEQAAPTEE